VVKLAYQVTFRPETEQDFERIDKQISQRIFNKIKWLSENIEIITPLPLKGKYKGKFKLRIGDYRVIYSLNKEEKRITIHMAGHRREIYKGL